MGHIIKLNQQINTNKMVDTKQEVSLTSVEKVHKKGSSKNTELIKRKNIPDSPFEVITKDGKSFGVMGQYRLTEPSTSAKEIERELKKITWNRLIQIVMILHEINNKYNKKEDQE